MNQLKLFPIRERLRRVTPGPWHVWEDDGWYAVHTGAGPCGEENCTGYDVPARSCEAGRDDAKFIANAPTDIANLIAEVERLRALIDERMPCNGACSPGRPDFECPLHGMSPSSGPLNDVERAQLDIVRNAPPDLAALVEELEADQ